MLPVLGGAVGRWYWSGCIFAANLRLTSSTGTWAARSSSNVPIIELRAWAYPVGAAATAAHRMFSLRRPFFVTAKRACTSANQRATPMTFSLR